MAKPLQTCRLKCTMLLEHVGINIINYCDCEESCRILICLSRIMGGIFFPSLSFVSCAVALSFIKSLPSFLLLAISTTWLWLHLKGPISFHQTTNHVLLKSVSSKRSSVIVAWLLWLNYWIQPGLNKLPTIHTSEVGGLTPHWNTGA